MYTEIKCRIKKIASTQKSYNGKITGGYGFLVKDDNEEPLILRDIFFHRKNVIEVREGDVEWEDLKEGMIVIAGVITPVPRGFEAFEISIPMRKPQKKNHKFK